MNKNNIIICRQLVPVILLIVYCISFIPSIISHEHSDNHDKFSDCESFTENIGHHINCSHEHHLNKLHEDCFLCDHYISYDHLSSFFIIESNDRLVIVKSYKICDRVNSKESINLSNKSPPILI